MSANKRTEIDELHSFLKSKLMHRDDPRRRLLDNAFVGIVGQRSGQIEEFCMYTAMRTRRWPYFSALAIYNYDINLNLDDLKFVQWLKKHLQDFPRLAYLNVSIDDPVLESFCSNIDELLRIPEYRDFWAGFGPVEQKERVPEDKSNIQEEIRKAVNVEVNIWKRSFESDLKDELRERIKHELKQEMRQEIRNQLEAELRVSIEEELKAEFREHIKTRLDEERIKQELKQEMRQEIRNQLEAELSMSIKEELKAEFREHIETRLDEEIRATVRLAERGVCNEKDSNSVNKEPANGLSMDDERNETKRIVTETIEELTGDLVSILEPQIKAKITKSVKDELKDELMEEVANDLRDFKRDMKKKQSKMMDAQREQLHEDVKDEIMLTIQQDLNKCLLDLRKTYHK